MANIDYTWVVKTKNVCECVEGGCTGLMDLMVVDPQRSAVYTNTILMCNKCKAILT
jgi:hypothetical protein